MIGEKILELKKKSGLTWKLLAREIGVEPNTVQLWKNGFVKSVRQDNLDKLKTTYKKYGIK